MLPDPAFDGLSFDIKSFIFAIWTNSVTSLEKGYATPCITADELNLIRYTNTQ